MLLFFLIFSLWPPGCLSLLPVALPMCLVLCLCICEIMSIRVVYILSRENEPRNKVFCTCSPNIAESGYEKRNGHRLRTKKKNPQKNHHHKRTCSSVNVVVNGKRHYFSG